MGIRNEYDVSPSLAALNSYEKRSSLDFAEEIQLGVTIADFSKSFAVESIEARFFSSTLSAVDPHGTITPVVQLHAGTKPVVIERIEVYAWQDSDTAGAKAFYMGPVSSNNDYNYQSYTSPLINLGGTETSAFAKQGYSDHSIANPVPLNESVSASGNADFNWFSSPTFRIFLEPGEHFTVLSSYEQLGDASTVLRVIWLGREIPTAANVRRPGC